MLYFGRHPILRLQINIWTSKRARKSDQMKGVTSCLTKIVGWGNVKITTVLNWIHMLSILSGSVTSDVVTVAVKVRRPRWAPQKNTEFRIGKRSKALMVRQKMVRNADKTRYKLYTLESVGTAISKIALAFSFTYFRNDSDLVNTIKLKRHEKLYTYT